MRNSFCGYRLVEQLSKNDVIQSWEGESLVDGGRCFLKICPDSVLSAHPEIRRVLGQSMQLQKRLYRGPFLLAKRLTESGQGIAVEYPWLDTSSLVGLDSATSPIELRRCLPHLCMAIDLLHALGMVHCDVKLANCLVDRSSQGNQSLLVDLDFLSIDGAKPLSTLLGTPGYIAPEILRNERITTASDCYSLGSSLHQFLADRATSEAYGGDNHQLSAFAGQLCKSEPSERPRSLVTALKQAGIIDAEQEQALLRQMLGLLLFNRFAERGRGRLRSPRGIRHFVVERCRVVGVPHELMPLLARARQDHARACRHVVASLIENATIECTGGHWLVNVSDHSRLAAYRELLPMTGRPWPDTGGQTCDIESFRSLYENGFPEAAYLGLRNAVALPLTFSPDHTEALRHQCLADWSRDLGRLQESRSWYTRLVASEGISADVRIRAILEQAMVHVKLGEYDAAEKILSGCGDGPDPLSARSVVRGNRIHAWIKSQRGDHAGAEKLLEEAAQVSEVQALHEERMLTLYAVAVMAWRKGELRIAISRLEEAYRLAETHRLHVKALPITSTLSLLSADTAQYRSAIRWGLRTIRIATAAGLHTQLPPVHMALTLAYTRLGDLNRSSACLGSYLATNPYSGGSTHLLTYYQARAFTSILAGDVQTAAEACRYALDIAGDGNAKLLGKVCSLMAEIELLRGIPVEAGKWLTSAKSWSERAGDTTSCLEIEILDKICKAVYSENVCTAELLSVAEQLYNIGSLHPAANGAMFALILSEGPLGPTPWLTRLVRCPELSEESVVVFAVVRQLMAAVNHGDDLHSFHAVTVWKAAFSILQDGHQSLAALLIARRIGRLYASVGLSRHSQKFLEQASLIANALENKRLDAALRSEIANVRPPGADADSQVSLLETVSAVLAQVADFDRTAERLLNIAVEYTGAERGVLLLRAPHRSRLSIVAHVNCDEASLEDIVQFSARTAASAFAASTPILIENARTDIRTREFPSIISQNIRAVLAAPMVVDGQTVGVVYLDHHVLPAMFSPADLSLVRGIAGFAGAALRTSTHFLTLQRTAAAEQAAADRLGTGNTFYTEDQQLLSMLTQLRKVAASDAPILVTGESGTGKELLARYIHAHSPRNTSPFVTVNCAAIAPTMVESELFGVAKGAATGVVARDGRFAAADGGTLFLDEIGDMPQELQAKVLRAIENQEFERVGSNRTVHVDVRIVCATNKDLHQLMEEKRFRADLYFRIAAFSVQLPPLRDRRKEIPMLIEVLLGHLTKGNRKLPRFSQDAMVAICCYSWPGNVRELRNFLERYVILYGGQTVALQDLPPEIGSASTTGSGAQVAQTTAEVASMRRLLLRTNGNVSRAARLAKIPLSTFRRRISKLGLRDFS